jgi:ribosomal protein RSM22 (predicted rRNA methylase)
LTGAIFYITVKAFTMYQLPEEIIESIDGLSSKVSTKALQQAVAALTMLYKRATVRRLETPEEHIAYLVCRFPATFAVNRTVFSQLDCQRFQSFLDVGAGPATSLLALLQQCSIQQATLIERDPQFIRMAKELLAPYPVKTAWQQNDALQALTEAKPHDLVCASYMLSEGDVSEVVEQMWKKCNSHLVLIETGTPKGYEALMQARDILIASGAKIIAPCPHHQKCPMPESDWCHFAVRLARSKLHRQLKEAELGYEDEKYSYLIVAKENATQEVRPRIVGAPCRRSGHVHFKLCMPDGTLAHQTVSRKDKEAYKDAKEASWGDSL